jgi:DNA-binding HxlR family transcriptional regulator
VSVHTAETAAVAAAADVVGDRWSLRLIHALLAGPGRFGDLQADVPGIAPNVLSQRLRSLAADGLVVAERYHHRPPRFVYDLTARGRELAGVLRALASWADDDLAPVHDACGTRLELTWRCPTCATDVVDGDERLVHL